MSNSEESTSDISLLDFEERILEPSKDIVEMPNGDKNTSTPQLKAGQLQKWESVQPLELLQMIENETKLRQRGSADSIKKMRQVLDEKLRQLVIEHEDLKKQNTDQTQKGTNDNSLIQKENDDTKRKLREQIVENSKLHDQLEERENQIRQLLEHKKNSEQRKETPEITIGKIEQNIESLQTLIKDECLEDGNETIKKNKTRH